MYTVFARVGVINGPAGATVVLPVLATTFAPKPVQCLVERALPVNAGLSVGMQVDCAGLVWQEVAVMASGEPEKI